MKGKRPGGWVALAVRYWRDPKIVAVSLEAQLLYVNGLCYSGEQETDGRVPMNVLAALQPKVQPRADGRVSRGVRACAGELVRVGLWEKTGDGYAVPFDTWSRWQETAAEKAAARARDAQRKADWRAGRRGSPLPRDEGQGECPTTSGVGVGAGVGHSPTTPAPQPEREHQHQEDPAPLRWEEYTDAAGNLYVRNIANGQADPEGEP